MSNPKNQTCFDQDYLQRYLSEQLLEQEENEVRDHLNSCPECQRQLENAAGEPAIWDGLIDHLNQSTAETNVEEPVHRLLRNLAPTDNPDMIGRIGSYEIVGLVGQGSTGIVLKALEPRLNRYVAIKILSPAYSANGAARKRFEREARAIAAVTDEHVVPIYAVNEFRGLPYIVMQYVPGISLLQRIEKEGPLDTCEVTRIGLQVAKGLQAAHAQGIVHRDVKPANVLLEETVERAMVTDFGLARVADEASMTRSGTIAGTPQYMSPEQARGESIDPRSDLFSLGSLMYAACTARPPFRAETLMGVIHRVCNAEPRPIREINPQIAPWMVQFIDRLISKTPEQRFQSAADVTEGLATELAHLQNPTVVPEPHRSWLPERKVAAPDNQAKKLRGNKRLLAAGVTMLIVLAGFVAWSFTENGQSWFSAMTQPGSAAANDWIQDEQLSNAEEKTRVSWKTNEVGFDTDATPTVDQKIERTINVNGEQTLTISADYGDIVVQPSELDDRIMVTVLRRVAASGQEEASVMIDDHDIVFAEGPDGWSITGELNEESSAKNFQDRFKKVLYRVSVPRNFNHQLTTGKGSVTVGSFVGDVNVTTDNGHIDFDRIDGDVKAQSTGGNICLHQGATGKAELLVVRGNAYVSQVDTESRVITSGGNAWLGGCSGKVYAQTSGGNVKITKVDGPTRVHTCDGDVIVNLTESPSADSKFTATNGNVTVRVSEEIEAKLVELPHHGDEAADSDENLDQQELNGGGSLVEAFSSTGDVKFVVLAARDAQGLGGSGGLGGSASGGTKKTPTAEAIAKTKGAPRPGAIATIELENSDSIDGYTLYLPESHAKNNKSFPIIVYLQGAYGVGGPVSNVNLWGLTRLIRDESDLSTERNQLLLDSFIVVSPHIKRGQYHDDANRVQKIIEDVADNYRGDLERVYVTGVSRGGHGSWGLAAKLPNTFAAIAPMGGNTNQANDLDVFKDVAIWIGHNQGDTTVEIDDVVKTAEKIEKHCSVKFLRTESANASDSPYLESAYVLASPKVAGHDVWTDTYTSVEFYKWLLAQSRTNDN